MQDELDLDDLFWNEMRLSDDEDEKGQKLSSKIEEEKEGEEEEDGTEGSFI